MVVERLLERLLDSRHTYMNIGMLNVQLTSTIDLFIRAIAMFQGVKSSLTPCTEEAAPMPTLSHSQ